MTSTEVATIPKRTTLTQKVTELSQRVEDAEFQRDKISEALTNAVAMLRQEDIGWAGPTEGDYYKGLKLNELQGWAQQIRASLTGTAKNAPNPHMRNGLMLRHSFIWNGDIHYDDIPGAPKAGDNPTPTTGKTTGNGTRGKTNVHNLIQLPNNQRLFFGSTARKQREEALYSTGLYIVMGDNEKRTLRPVPLADITETFRDEIFEDEIIAYRWTRQEAETKQVGKKTILTGNRVSKSVWVYVDWYDGDKFDAIKYNNVDEPVLKNFTAFDLHANRPEGHAFGSPDSVAALVWARIIRDLIMNGVKMQDAMAMFAFKITSPTKAGQQGIALELAQQKPPGSAATMGGENDVSALSTAGHGYDFGSIGFIVSTMAASLHVSGIALAANTSLAGSSYGAAKTLDLPGQMAMETRRAEHIEFDKRVLRWLGAPDAKVYFDTFEDSTDEYRAVQAAMLAWTTGTLTPEGFRAELEIIYGRKLIGPIPTGVVIPNNQKQLDAATKAAADAKADPNAPTKTAPAADQGKNKGTGSADHTTDAKPQSGK